MTALMKHNPAFLTEDELVRSFVVREADLQLLLETLRENIGAPANQHLLVVGPRGMGKTTLARRVATECRRDPVLREAWYPIAFGEEAYEVASAGEFWLEALLHLADDTGEPRWRSAYEKLLGEADEARLQTIALARLLDFADEQGKRILLIVENLQMLLADGQLSDTDGWTLRHTLQNEPRLMLLATAPTRFDELQQPKKPMYELFRVQTLDPLDDEGCRSLWARVAGHPLRGMRIKPIRILTGGNPRLVVVLAGFAANRSFRQLMTDLTQLVDEHTTYFKANVEALPAQERKVFVTLADLWAPAGSREVAQRARMEVNKVSAHLKRLVDRGAVVEVTQIGRVKLFQLAERMYNIYHLMRRRGIERAHVRALVEFMIHFYDRDSLLETAAGIASEACCLGPDERGDHSQAFVELVRRMDDVGTRGQLFRCVPPEFFELDDAPSALRAMYERFRGADDGAEDATEEMLRVRLAEDPEDGWAWRELGYALGRSRRPTEALAALERAIELAGPDDFRAHLGRALALKDLDRPQEAEAICRTLLEQNPNLARGWEILGYSLWKQTGRERDAVTALEMAADLDADVVDAWRSLARLYAELGERRPAEEAWRQVLALAPHDGTAMLRLGGILAEDDRWAEAEECFWTIPEGHPAWLSAQVELAWVLDEQGRRDEACNLLEKATAKTSDQRSWPAWNNLGVCLFQLDRLDDAIAAFERAVELAPEMPYPQLNLANGYRRQGRDDDAYRLLSEVRVKEPNLEPAMTMLLGLLHDRQDEEAARQEARRFFEAVNAAPQDLNELAWKVHELDWQALFPDALQWATEAHQQAPGDLHVRHTMATLLSDVGRWAEALDVLRPALGDRDFVAAHPEDFTDFIVAAAAAGHADAMLAAIADTPAAEVLQPAMVALQMLTGEDTTRVPLEVHEVARDVLAAFEARRAALNPPASATSPASPGGPGG